MYNIQRLSITLQLVDRSIRRPRGILEDVLVKVDQFILPTDFIVLDMEESPMFLPLPIILGRPFMRTTYTKICVKNCTVSIKVNGVKIEFKIFNELQLPQDDLDCFNVVEIIFQVHHIDPLEATLTHSITRQDIKPNYEDVIEDIIETIHFLEASPISTTIPKVTTDQ
jgi:hypothetical protein